MLNLVVTCTIPLLWSIIIRNDFLVTETGVSDYVIIGTVV